MLNIGMDIWMSCLAWLNWEEGRIKWSDVFITLAVINLLCGI